ncbi:MAG: M48 family metallopeptidase [Verrucomicrobiota bacterium]
MSRLVPFGVAVAGAVLLACCVSNDPITDRGKERLNLVDPQQEVELGEAFFRNYKLKHPRAKDASLSARAEAVASRLFANIPSPGGQWEVVVFEDESPNAFSLPGGKIGLNSSIFQIAKTDGQLATVIGHEAGHIISRHSGERLTRSALAEALTLGGDGLVIRSFSRRQELEADELSVRYLRRAGYDPQEALDFWLQFAAFKEKESGGVDQSPELFSTHPTDEKRIEALRQLIAAPAP